MVEDWNIHSSMSKIRNPYKFIAMRPLGGSIEKFKRFRKTSLCKNERQRSPEEKAKQERAKEETRKRKRQEKQERDARRLAALRTKRTQFRKELNTVKTLCAAKQEASGYKRIPQAIDPPQLVVSKRARRHVRCALCREEYASSDNYYICVGCHKYLNQS